MIRVITGGIFILLGMAVLLTAVIGIFRFSTMLNRIHSASKCDTIGALLILSGLMIFSGMTVYSLKLFLVIVILWLCNPAARYLIARAEVQTNNNLENICDFMDITEKSEGEELNDNN